MFAMTLSDAMGKLPGDCMGRFLKGFQPQLNSMADSLESFARQANYEDKIPYSARQELPNIIEKSSLFSNPSALSLRQSWSEIDIIVMTKRAIQLEDVLSVSEKHRLSQLWSRYLREQASLLRSLTASEFCSPEEDVEALKIDLDWGIIGTIGLGEDIVFIAPNAIAHEVDTVRVSVMKSHHRRVVLKAYRHFVDAVIELEAKHNFKSEKK